MDISELLHDPANQIAAVRISVALLAGGLIGLERSHHGRPAGFRTHALVCMASAILMLIGVFETRWLPDGIRERVTLDPTRLAQGIMTGIGFLGAGTIVKEGLTVQGLTTAASIWITATIGILVGVGLYGPAACAVVLTLGTLAAFRSVERLVPVQFTANLTVRFASASAPSDPELRKLLQEHGFSVGTIDYRYDGAEAFMEYRISISSQRASDAQRLNNAVRVLPGVQRFVISAIGD